MIVLTALGTLGVLTTITVRGGLQTTASDRFHQIAVYAAESGGAVAMSFLRATVNAATKWSDVVDPSTPAAPVAHVPVGLLGNLALPGEPGNPFTSTLGASYSVEILNNRGDPGYALGDDTDARVIIRSTGHGPDGATSIIEWEVTMEATTSSTPCRVYAMENQSEDNSGNNRCIGTIDTSQTATFTP
jgi:hypothetical protein